MFITFSKNIINIIHDYVVTTLVAEGGIISKGMIESCVERPLTEIRDFKPFPTVLDKAGC